MRISKTSIPVLSLLALSLAAMGCAGPCAKGDAVVPGAGLAIDGERFCLGDDPADLEKRFGAPAETSDLGTLGTRFTYPDQGVTGTWEEGEEGPVVTTLYADETVTSVTSGGLGIGSTLSQIEAELGSGSRDPFVGHLWYMDLGIAFELEDDSVGRLHLFPIEAEEAEDQGQDAGGPQG